MENPPVIYHDQISVNNNFNTRIPQSYRDYLIFNCTNVEPKKKKIFMTSLSAPSIDNSNRRSQWLKMTGGDVQINKLCAKQLYDAKYQDMYRNSENLSESLAALNPPHDCFTCRHSICCLEYLLPIDGMVPPCQNPDCPKVLNSQILNKNSDFHCCIMYGIAKRTSDIILTSFPNINYCPVLIYLAKIFTLIFTHDYQSYACLCGIIKTTKLNFLDQTRTMAHVSSAILRTFCIDLMHSLFQKKNVQHNWLKQLYQLNPYEFFPNSKSSNYESRNFWLIPDWPVLLFKHTSAAKMIQLIDIYLNKGLKVLYRHMLYYLSILFIQLNSEKKTENSYEKFSIDIITHKLSTIISNELILATYSKQISAAEKIKITNKNLNKMKSRFLNIFIHTSCFTNESDIIDHSITRFDQNQTWPSTTIHPHEWDTLISWLPPGIQLLSPSLVYSSSIHGWNLRTFYLKSEELEPIVIMIRTTCSSIFGGFLTQCLKTRHNTAREGSSSFGTGESFVFSIRPSLRKYPWSELYKNSYSLPSHMDSVSTEPDCVVNDSSNASEKNCPTQDILKHNWSCEEPHLPNDIFVVANDKGISIGGGGGYAIWLDETLVNGSSSNCSTFNNEPFVSGPVGFFKSTCVEVFSFLDTNFVVI